MPVICQKTYTIVVNPTSYLAYYKCENAADPIVDSIAGVNLSSTGAIVQAPGIIGNGYDVDTWEANSASTTKFNFLSHDFTIRMWVKMDWSAGILGQSQFSMLMNHANDEAWELYMTRYNYQLGPNWYVWDSLNNSHFVNQNVLLQPGWHRIVCWVKTGVEIGMRIGETGSPDFWQGTTPVPLPIYNPGATSGLYVAHGSSGWHDVIDEIAIWDRLLTAAELTADWNGGAGRTYP